MKSVVCKKTQYPLYLASGSATRKSLLTLSQIPFHIVSQNADESKASLEQSLQSLVTELAQLKMNHIVYPFGKEGDVAFFLTADTMTIDLDGKLYGKPINRADAIDMLRACRKGATVGTAFCLERKIFSEGVWVKQGFVVGYDQAWCIVDIPETFIDFYLDRVPFLDLSGAISIEGFGDQFVKEVRGSYSAILGLPMYKVREALCELGFYSMSF